MLKSFQNNKYIVCNFVLNPKIWESLQSLGFQVLPATPKIIKSDEHECVE